MANNTNAQAIKFSNEDVRTVADAMSQLYYKCVDIANRWSAAGQNIDALFPATNDFVGDSATVAPVDGRPPITNNQVRGIMDRVFEYKANMEATSNAKLAQITAVAVNTK